MLRRSFFFCGDYSHVSGHQVSADFLSLSASLRGDRAFASRSRRFTGLREGPRKAALQGSALLFPGRSRSGFRCMVNPAFRRDYCLPRMVDYVGNVNVADAIFVVVIMAMANSLTNHWHAYPLSLVDSSQRPLSRACNPGFSLLSRVRLSHAAEPARDCVAATITRRLLPCSPDHSRRVSAMVDRTCSRHLE